MSHVFCLYVCVCVCAYVCVCTRAVLLTKPVTQLLLLLSPPPQPPPPPPPPPPPHSRGHHHHHITTTTTTATTAAPPTPALGSFQYLTVTYPQCDVEWLNRDGETKASYDIKVTDKVLERHTHAAAAAAAAAAALMPDPHVPPACTRVMTTAMLWLVDSADCHRSAEWRFASAFRKGSPDSFSLPSFSSLSPRHHHHHPLLPPLPPLSSSILPHPPPSSYVLLPPCCSLLLLPRPALRPHPCMPTKAGQLSTTFYVEVKSTIHSDKNAFYFSLWELDLATRLGPVRVVSYLVVSCRVVSCRSCVRAGVRACGRACGRAGVWVGGFTLGEDVGGCLATGYSTLTSHGVSSAYRVASPWRCVRGGNSAEANRRCEFFIL
jgi:hypothetical protein